MKVAVICKSDTNGGAAVVSRRLIAALRSEGVDATMLVADRPGACADGLPVVEARYPLLKPAAFMAERLQIFMAEGGSLRNLFKLDTARFGLPLWRHPVVRESDAVILNWFNQGMLSLNGVRCIAGLGKRVIWTMHDMWPLTGICHHAMDCRRYTASCGCCPYLGAHAGPGDLSHKVWKKKDGLYRDTGITFVAVSSWLAEKARESSLLAGQRVEVIPNAINPLTINRPGPDDGKRRILFSAATLDNWIKGLDTFREAIEILARRNPEEASRCEVVLMGSVKDPATLEGFAIPARHLGMVTGEERIAGIYSDADVTVNTSSFENLPGTLVEAQAYGSVPVAFDRGGQRDIIAHGATGYLAEWSDEPRLRAAAIADGIAVALRMKEERGEELKAAMRSSVEDKFSYRAVARSYLSLLL